MVNLEIGISITKRNKPWPLNNMSISYKSKAFPCKTTYTTQRANNLGLGVLLKSGICEPKVKSYNGSFYWSASVISDGKKMEGEINIAIQKTG